MTILWSELVQDEIDLVKLVAARYEEAVENDVVIRRMVAAPQSSTLLSALDDGAVVLIATGGREASMGLALGVDEVLRAGELTVALVNQAIQRALARAEGRAQRDARAQQRDARTFSLLAAALGNELGASLSIASTCCEVLSTGLPSRLSASDELMNWAVSSAPGERTRQLVAVCATAPTANELSVTADDAKDSVARALSIVKTLRELSFDGGQRFVAIDPLLEELAEMLRAYVGAWAELELAASADAVAAISRSNLTWIMATLIASALEAVRASENPMGKIVMRSLRHGDCVVVEVEHDDKGDLAAVASTELVSLREQTRQLGGELLFDHEGERSCYRLMINAVDEPLAEQLRRPAGWDHAKELEN